MVSLLVGIVMVVASAAGFGYALFGRRPVPQPATSLTAPAPAPALAEPAPSDEVGDVDAVEPRSGFDDVIAGSWLRRLIAREPTANHQPMGDVTLSPWQRLRAGMLLALTVVGLAALIGAVAATLIVGLVLIAT